jgi:FlaA1/EpsC-like NDP-sugar epimerase
MAVIALLVVNEYRLIPWSVLGIFWALSLLYIGGSRLLAREYFQKRQKAADDRERVAIYGAGSAGIELAIGLKSGRDYKPVAFIDEKNELAGTTINNIQVYAPDHLPRLIEAQGINQVLLAIPEASRARRREIINRLEHLPVHVRTIPALGDLVSGVARVDEIQEVDIADLLGRDPVPPNEALFGRCVRGKSVMVTGAGGSIGSELCRQILRLHPSRLVLFEQSEYALYQIEKELRQVQQHGRDIDGSLDIIPVLGTVTQCRRVEAVLRSFGVQTIYHAAAYKHVPLVEMNPIEGVRNNVFGTWRAAEAALAAGVETFVLVSTDKAVRPTNIMGASKRLAELILQALAKNRGGTRFCMVRFGNVLGSSGSVVPLFREQIRQGGPVTVTHPEITRYFMTISEAVQLVIQAGSMGEGGDVFVLDMGEPVRIADLARRMIHLSGLSIHDEEHPDGEIAIVYTGLRPGEKLYEELLIGADVTGTDHPRILRAKEAELPWTELSRVLRELETAAQEFDSDRVRALLERTVSGYRPQCEIVDPVWLNTARTAVAGAPKPTNIVPLPSKPRGED